MLNSLPVCLAVGAVFGFLAGLGVGGGSLLMLWLTLVLNMDYTAAKIINLLFFIPTAVISSVFRWRQGALNIQQILPAVLFGCITAAACAFFGQRADLDLLKKLFGVLLLITGLREIAYRERKPR